MTRCRPSPLLDMHLSEQRGGALFEITITSSLGRLTEREHEVLRLMAERLHAHAVTLDKAGFLHRDHHHDSR